VLPVRFGGPRNEGHQLLLIMKPAHRLHHCKMRPDPFLSPAWK